ncbi:MAG: JAB domain-containing protein [Flavobacterium stagni]
MSLARLRLEEESAAESIRNSSSAMKLLQSKFLGAPCEKFYCIYLNRANRVIRIELLSLGGISSTVVDIRLLMKRALDLCASAILVAHNHPSGNLVPSDEDIELTNKIKRAGDFLDIRLIDHLIVFENQYYSLADEGRI